VREIETEIGHTIPTGCLFENIKFLGIPNFSNLPPTSRIVFPFRDRIPSQHGGSTINMLPQAILTIWEENGPCQTVGKRLEKYYQKPGLSAAFVKAAQGKRGVMGFVLASGCVKVGDIVTVYPPVTD